MKKNNIEFTSETTAVTSKSFLKEAKVFGTKEYYILKKFKAENPDVVVSAKTIKKNPDKESYKNLSYSNMVAYISELTNKAELIDEFERQKRMAKIAKNRYRYMLNWFKSACFENDIEFEKFRSDLLAKTSEAIEANA